MAAQRTGNLSVELEDRSASDGIWFIEAQFCDSGASGVVFVRYRTVYRGVGHWQVEIVLAQHRSRAVLYGHTLYEGTTGSHL